LVTKSREISARGSRNRLTKSSFICAFFREFRRLETPVFSFDEKPLG